MGIKLNKETGLFDVQFSKRHPKTRMPKTLRRTGIKTMAEAQRVHNQLVIEVEDALKSNVCPTWRVMLERYFATAESRGLSKKTIESYQTSLEAHTLTTWGARRTDSILTEEIRNLILRLGSEVSVHTQRTILQYVRSVFNYAVETGAVFRNPTPHMKLRAGDKIKGVLTEPQMALLLNRAKEMNCEWYPHWSLALYTGMRSGELYALTWDKVSLDQRLIKVDCSWNSKDGFKSTKSGDDRMVEIAPPLIPVLQELKILNHHSEFVLPRLGKWDKGDQARELRFFLNGLGLPGIRFHDLRASWATAMLAHGVEPIKVMAMGGWKDLKTMMIYMRKAGIQIRGITDSLSFHNPSRETAKVIPMWSQS